jgi:hypothetical protein
MELQRRVGTEDIIQARENEFKLLKEKEIKMKQELS